MPTHNKELVGSTAVELELVVVLLTDGGATSVPACAESSAAVGGESTTGTALTDSSAGVSGHSSISFITPSESSSSCEGEQPSEFTDSFAGVSGQ